MLDLFGILFSSGIMLLVILRAVQMDRTQPWFRQPNVGGDSSGLKLRRNSLAAGNQAKQREPPRGDPTSREVTGRDVPGRDGA